MQVRLWAVAAFASMGAMVPNTTWVRCLAAASTIAAVGSKAAGMRHGPGYVSGKQTNCAPSPAARAMARSASAMFAASLPGGWQIGWTTAMRKVMALAPARRLAGVGRQIEAAPPRGQATQAARDL